MWPFRKKSKPAPPPRAYTAEEIRDMPAMTAWRAWLKTEDAVRPYIADSESVVHAEELPACRYSVSVGDSPR